MITIFTIAALDKLTMFVKLYILTTLNLSENDNLKQSLSLIFTIIFLFSEWGEINIIMDGVKLSGIKIANFPINSFKIIVFKIFDETGQCRKQQQCLIYIYKYICVVTYLLAFVISLPGACCFGSGSTNMYLYSGRIFSMALWDGNPLSSCTGCNRYQQ